MSVKTNAARILDAGHISYRLISYPVDESKIDAVHVALQCGLNPETVFKTLVAAGDKNGINVFCIPAEFELDLKKAAAVSKNKKVEMVRVKELFELTGYIRGGCSPIGMKKKYPTFIDETAFLSPLIYVSGGMRGVQIEIVPDALVNIISASVADLIE